MIPFRGIPVATVVFLGIDMESLVRPIRVGSVVGWDGWDSLYLRVPAV
jgi:hypothetical protein